MKIKSPFSGLCLPDTWYEPYQYEAFLFREQVCPDVLLVGAGAVVDQLQVNFNGRGWVNAGACGTDSYVSPLTFPEVYDGWETLSLFNTLLIDVWGAHRAGVWTSSTTVQIAVARSGAPSRTLYAQPRNNADLRVDKAVTAQNCSLCCPTDLKATVTVNDDGTIGIA